MSVQLHLTFSSYSLGNETISKDGEIAQLSTVPWLPSLVPRPLPPPPRRVHFSDCVTWERGYLTLQYIMCVYMFMFRFQLKVENEKLRKELKGSQEEAKQEREQ